jgi:hypothetical protein
MFEIWKDNVGAGIQDTIKVAGAAYDLGAASGVRFRMRPELSPTLKVDRAAQIVQAGAPPTNKGVVKYTPVAADVDTAGFFVGWWQVTLTAGGTFDTDEFVVVVREHGSSIDLCTVADVKAYIGETSDDYNGEIADLVAAASTAFLERTRRELRPFAANPQTRVFDIDGDTIEDKSILVGDLASFTAIAIKAPDGTLFQNVDVASVVAQPRIRKVWQPIAELEFRQGFANSAWLRYGYTLEVSGNFGFPQVPADIRREVKKIAAAGLARDVKRTGRAFREAEPGFKADGGAMHEFPLSAEQVARRYRDVSF